MANPLIGQTPLKLKDGREFILVLDMEAMVEAEGAYGKPMSKLMADASAGFVGAVRATLYGALRAKHPTITLRDASAMFQSDGERVEEAMERAAEAAFPDAEPSEGKESANPPGKRSGRSGAKSA